MGEDKIKSIGSVSSYLKFIAQKQMKLRNIDTFIQLQDIEYEISLLEYISETSNDYNVEPEDIYILFTEIEKLKEEKRNIENKSNNEVDNKSNIENDSYILYYRGQYDQKHKLLPSVLRADHISKEDYYYQEIMVKCAKEFRGLTHLERLVLMQHYGCPTRLLDITSNPLVALYFACKNYECKDCKTVKGGIIYSFLVKKRDILYFDSDRGLILSCIAKFNKVDKIALTYECCKAILSKKKFDNSYKSYDIVDRFYHEIRNERPAFEKKINPRDLLQSYFIQPPKSNNRIIKQDGAFVINGLCIGKQDIINRLDLRVFFKIRIINKERLLYELNKLGINEATLFPEMDKVANYLKER